MILGFQKKTRKICAVDNVDKSHKCLFVIMLHCGKTCLVFSQDSSIAMPISIPDSRC